MQPVSFKSSSRSVSRFIVVAVVSMSLGGCGGDCNIFQSAAGDAGCRRLGLDGNRTFVGTKASCAGAANSRGLTVNCPAPSGTASHCNSALSGFPIFSLVVPNNSSGSFRDTSGTLYSDCQSLLTAYNNGSLVNVTGVYVSESGVSSDNVACTDGGGCTMTSPQCYAGWDSTNLVLAGTASIPLGTKILTCTYIDTTALGGPPDISVGAWANPPTQITVGGNLNFVANWVDAF